MSWLDLVGWFGSALLIVSVMQARVLRFRVLNLLACVVLTGFNAALEIWPMVAMNIALCADQPLAHPHAGRAPGTTRRPTTCSRSAPDDEYLRHVLRVHGADILKFQPDLVWDGAAPGRSAFLVQRGDETVGVVLVRDDGDGVARVQLDYVTPRYRDFSPGEFVWRRSSVLRERGFTAVVTPASMVGAYYERLGFHRDDRSPAPGRWSSDRRPVSRVAATQRSRVAWAAPESTASVARAMPAASCSSMRAGLGGVHGERGAGVEQHRVAHRPGLAGEQAAYDLGVVRRVLARAAPRRSPRACPSAAGSRVCSATSPSLTAHTLRGGGRGQLVEPVVAAEHPGVDAAAGEDPGHHRGHPAVGAADRLGLRAWPGWRSGRGS